MSLTRKFHPRMEMPYVIFRFAASIFTAVIFVTLNFLGGKYFKSFGILFAKVQYGEMIADMRGKINGTVHSRNRAGAYMRNKVTPVNPNTTYQTTVRNRLTARSQTWRTLTQLQRDAWNSAVSNFQKTNIFGQLRTPSGINLFNRLNMNLANIAATLLTEPPVPSGVAGLSSFSAVCDDSANSVTLTFGPAISAGENILVEATPPLSAGISFVKSEFRQIAVLDNTDTSPYVASADYSAKFGSTPVEGTKVFFRLTVIDNASGLSGIPLSTSTITVA